jgi:hypothetical protein
MTVKRVSVDETRSLAYREDGRVHVVLQLPDNTVAPGDHAVRLRTGDRNLRVKGTVTASDGGVRLSFSVPAKRLGRRTWSVTVQPERPGPFLRVSARLLAHPRLPVALLPGPTPRTEMAPPVPRRSVGPVQGRLLSPARRAAARVRSRLLQRADP